MAAPRLPWRLPVYSRLIGRCRVPINGTTRAGSQGSHTMCVIHRVPAAAVYAALEFSHAPFGRSGCARARMVNPRWGFRKRVDSSVLAASKSPKPSPVVDRNKADAPSRSGLKVQDES